jgi:membrane protein
MAVIPLLKEAYRDWNEDEAPRLAAALAYYTAFSLAPVLVIVVAVAGLAFGVAEVRMALVEQVRGMLGDGGGELVRGMLEAAAEPKESVVAIVLAFVTLLFGASGLFAQLQDALNTVWEVERKTGRGFVGLLKDRFLSFTMVLGVGFLLLVSLVLAAALQALQAFAQGHLGALAPALQALGFVLDLGLTALLFAMLFKFLPDVELEWNDVWAGSLATAVLFTIGKLALGAYIGRGAVGSAYGAAGSLAIVLIWVYYSAQILLFGAELTQVYARQRGSWVEPKEHAEPSRPDERPAAAAVIVRPPSPLAPRPLEPEVLPGRAQPPAFLGGVALGIAFGYLNQRLRRRLTPVGRWLHPWR